MSTLVLVAPAQHTGVGTASQTVWGKSVEVAFDFPVFMVSWAFYYIRATFPSG